MTVTRTKRRPTSGSKKKRQSPGSARVEVMRKAMAHPYRLKAFSIFAERVATPREIADSIGVELDSLSYHIRRLRDLGLIELVDERKVRGTVAHYYKAIDKPFVDDQEWEQLTSEEQATFFNFTFTLLASDLQRTISSKGWKARPDDHLTRSPMLLDEIGWKKVSRILLKTLDDIHQAHMDSITRSKGSTEGQIRAMVGMLFFEMAPPA